MIDADQFYEPFAMQTLSTAEAPMLYTETLATFMVQGVNVVSLESVLSTYDPAFRTAVREALLMEGFELSGSGLPNLQLAREILNAISWLGEGGYGYPWESFRQYLEWASHQGVLVNLGFESACAMGA